MVTGDAPTVRSDHIGLQEAVISRLLALCRDCADHRDDNRGFVVRPNFDSAKYDPHAGTGDVRRKIGLNAAPPEIQATKATDENRILREECGHGERVSAIETICPFRKRIVYVELHDMSFWFERFQ